MTRLIPYLLYLFLIGFHQVVLRDAISIYGATVALPALIVIIVALYKQEMTAWWFGFAAGLVVGAANEQTLGWSALLMAVVGLTVWHVKLKLNLDSLWSKLLVLAGGVFLANLLGDLILRPSDFLYLLWASALPGTLYTVAVGWLYFLIREGVVTWKRVKEIF